MDFNIHNLPGGDSASVYIQQGETLNLPFAALQDECDEFEDLTGYSFEGVIDTPTPLPFSSDAGNIVYSYPWGSIKAPSAATVGVPPGEYDMNFWAISPDGDKLPILPGGLIIGPTLPSLP